VAMIDRRAFVGDLVRLAALAAVVPNDWRVAFRPRFAGDPFLLGVASGDPLSNGVTLWTRLALEPLIPGGGMDGQRSAVRWELADDDKFTKVVKRGTATATPELGYSIHVNVDDLAPDRWYFYRFMAGDAISETGRTRTAPARGATTPLRFAVASCQHYEQGLYTAYRHMATEDLDLVTHLGDYIYEGGPTAGRTRIHSSPEIRQLDDYRQRYALYKMDADLRAAHAALPWVITWDDHEVSNNYAGLISGDTTMTRPVMIGRRGAAYQAWWEHMPVRVSQSRDWSTLSIARSIDWGALARFWVIDTRQFRSDQACNDGSRAVPCGDWSDPSRTVLGDAQEKWLSDGIGGGGARWEVLANQIMMAPYDGLAGDGTRVSMDQWSGYPVARDRLLGTIAQKAPNRTVVLTGDIHSSWVQEIRATFGARNAPTIGAEFIATSISSGGDGNDRTLATPDGIIENPHLKWQNARRGYFTCRVTAEDWRTDFRTLPFVTRPDAPIQTATSWMLRKGKPGIEPA
jgi:alkaline phosphatase D